MLWEELYSIFIESTEPFNQQTESCRSEYQQAHEFLKEVRFHLCVAEALTFWHSNKPLISTVSQIPQVPMSTFLCAKNARMETSEISVRGIS